MMAPRRASRCTPMDSTMVTMAGSPSGMAATASETAVMSISAAPFPRAMPRVNTTVHTPMHSADSFRETSPILR